MHEQFLKVTEEMKRRDRQQEEHQRESQRLKEEQDSLQKHRGQLEDELQELRYGTNLRTPGYTYTNTIENSPLLYLNKPMSYTLTEIDFSFENSINDSFKAKVFF